MNDNDTQYPRPFSPLYHQTSLQSQTREAIRQAARTGIEGEPLALADYTSFDWDRVYIFGMGASHSYINQVIGSEWLVGTGYVEEQRQLFVFVEGDKVVQHLLFRPEIALGGTDYRLGVCLSRSRAIFAIDGYDTSGGRIRFLSLPEKTDGDS